LTLEKNRRERNRGERYGE